MQTLVSKWRPITSVFLVGGLVLVIVFTAAVFLSRHVQPTVDVVIGTQPYTLDVADSNELRELGLSNTESLKDGAGLLMSFENDDFHSIWMKDMKIPIDVIWLNSKKEVVDIKSNLSPSSGTSRVFAPKKESRYIIEIPAGAVKRSGVRSGDKLDFDVGGFKLWW